LSCDILKCLLILSFLGPNIFLSTLFQILGIIVFHQRKRHVSQPYKTTGKLFHIYNDLQCLESKVDDNSFWMNDDGGGDDNFILLLMSL
jgi:hypothetical protein